MAKLLMVPVHLDALCLSEDTFAPSSFAAFELQPYFDATTQQDFQSGTPLLASKIESEPFSDRTLPLETGVHLHWALPDSIARAIHRKGVAVDGTEDDVEFLPAPNRWLVIRSDNENGNEFTLKTCWMVESDFVAETSDKTNNGVASVSYPVPLTGDNSIPFRFLGRLNKLDTTTGWRPDDPKNYLPHFGSNLTATGYGEPTFAAFYPNCYGIFGMHDPVPALKKNGPVGEEPSTRYEIFGWYQDKDKDPFVTRTVTSSSETTFTSRFESLEDLSVKMLLNRYVKDPNAKGPESTPLRTKFLTADDQLTDRDFSDAFLILLQEEFGWTIEKIDSNQNLPITVRKAGFDGMVCYSRLTLTVAEQTAEARPDVAKPVAIGTSGAEALAASLAFTLLPSSQSSSGLPSREQIEEQILALELAPSLAGHRLDLGPKFREIRHLKEFRSVSGEGIWSIRPATGDNDALNGPSAANLSQITLPPELAHQLNLLNLAQASYDRATYEIESLRQQLLDDWNKYLELCYPGVEEFSIGINNSARISEAIDYIQTNYLQQDGKSDPTTLRDKLATRGKLNFERQKDGSRKVIGGDDVDSIAHALKKALTDVSTSLDIVNRDREKQKLVTIVLQLGPGPSYWEPNEPVVLLAGDPSVEPSDRHGRDGSQDPQGFLACTFAEVDFVPTKAGFDLANKLRELLDRIDAQRTLRRQNDKPAGRTGFDRETRNPWNPFLLEWEALIETEEQGSDGFLKPYDPKFIEAKTKSLVNLETIGTDKDKAETFKPIRGRSVLSSHPKDLLRERLSAYLLDLALTVGKANENNLTENDITPENIDSAVRGTPIGDAARTFQAALNVLEKLPCLAQSLGGFNQGLLMHRTGTQLPVIDPLALADPAEFDTFRKFSEEVATAFLDSAGNEQRKKGASSADLIRHLGSPEPAFPFYPIRTGHMILTRLRVVDTFGQVVDWSTEDVIAASNVDSDLTDTDSGLADRTSLSIRITQPTRFGFRWLSANDDDIESNDHPATSPICGWVIPNHLDQSLLVYDTDGGLLGSVDEGASWRMAPGQTTGPVRPQDINNAHLRKLVEWLTSRGENKFQEFLGLDQLQKALDKIDPENYAQHRARALLVGRPLALARVRVNLELYGLPANSQSDHDFLVRLQGGPQNQRQFTKVEFPITIGDHDQFNDGVVAYWEELMPTAPLSDAASLPAVNPTPIFMTIDSKPVTVSLLIDPRAGVHVFSGILPSKSLTIPPDQYVNALKSMEVNFFSGPVVTEPDKTEVPVSTEPGFSWTWIQMDGSGWTLIPEDAVLEKKVILKAFPNQGEAIWERLETNGWVQLTSDREHGLVIHLNGDARPTLGEDLKDIEAAIERVIDISARSIHPIRQHAHFGPRAEIREGWLQVGPNFDL